ncbi:MAG: hypothetical protein HC915_01110 [Anaerolineae bacterium]|nr:hypothetical protein [Anaerolineae bacterium]
MVDGTYSGEFNVSKYLQLMARYERLMEITRQLNSMLDLHSLLQRIMMLASNSPAPNKPPSCSLTNPLANCALKPLRT